MNSNLQIPSHILNKHKRRRREASAMEEGNEEFDSLFDYARIQPPDFFTFDDSDIEKSEIFVHCRKKGKKATTVEAKEGSKGKGDCMLTPEEKIDTKKKENEEDDWLAPPPPKNLTRKECEEDSILQELRLRKQELTLSASPAEDVLLKDVIENAKTQVKSSKRQVEAVVLNLPPEVREKIVISIQDKDGKKQFCIYKDDKFERLFKIYAKKVNLKPEDLIFSFDGEKVNTTSTPVSLKLEDDDMLEVHVKSH